MARDFLGEFGPERSIRSRGGNQGRDQRDVMNYRPPSRVATPFDPRSVGLHGDNCGCEGSQGPYHKSKESSGGPGIGGDEIRQSGSQGRR